MASLCVAIVKGRSRAKFALLLVTGLLSGGQALAAHPLITDDAGIIGAGSGQFEINGEYGRDRERAAGVLTEERSGEIAAALSHGLSDTVDVVVGFPYLWARQEENGIETGSGNGAGDVLLEMKWRFYEKNALGLAVKPGLSLPSGNEDKGLGNGRATCGIVFIGTQEVEPFAFHLNLGYVANENKVGDRRDIWHVSLAGEIGVAERLKIVANIGVETNPDSGSSTHPAFVLAGLVWSAADDLDFDLGVKSGLNEAEIDITGMWGVSIRF